ncbi:hypothetical protein QYR58_01860 [Streptococcus iniae]|nr:hypothetical protein QYR58_01860 [Streptococcus iniae]WNZ94589.1 hypothetical protein QYR54_00290 [Streptococcus iniae]
MTIQNTQESKAFFSFRKSKKALVSVGIASLFLGLGMTSVSAQEVTENQEALAQLETNAVTTPDFDSQLKTFEEQGFEIEKTVLEVSYEKGQLQAIQANYQDDYSLQLARLKQEVVAYQEQVAHNKAIEEANQKAESAYQAKIKANQEAKVWNQQQEETYKKSLASYEASVKDLGNLYQFSQEDKKNPQNNSSESLQLYGQVDESQKNNITYYQNVKIKADLVALEAHSLKDALTWTANTRFEKVSGDYKVETGNDLKNETDRVHHLNKLSGYKVGDSFKLTNVGTIETGQSLHLQVTIKSIGEGYGTKTETGAFTIPQALYVGKIKDANGADSFEFIYRNHRHLGFEFAFINDKNEPIRLFTSQILGDIDWGQEVSIDFGAKGQSLYTIPDGAKVTYKDGKFTSEESLAVENFDKTPEGTLLMLGVGEVMNYTHYTEPSYYQNADKSEMNAQTFEDEKLGLMNGSSALSEGKKRVAGILFSLFGKSITLKETIKPKQAQLKTIEEAVTPIAVPIPKVEKPRLKAKLYQFTEQAAKEVIEVSYGFGTVIDSDEACSEEIRGQLLGLTEVEDNYGPLIEEDYESPLEGMSGQTASLSVEENYGPIIEEDYQSPLEGMSGYSFDLFEEEDSKPLATLIGANSMSDSIEDSQEVPEYKVSVSEEWLDTSIEEEDPIVELPSFRVRRGLESEETLESSDEMSFETELDAEEVSSQELSNQLLRANEIETEEEVTAPIDPLILQDLNFSTESVAELSLIEEETVNHSEWLTELVFPTVLEIEAVEELSVQVESKVILDLVETAKTDDALQAATEPSIGAIVIEEVLDINQSNDDSEPALADLAVDNEEKKSLESEEAVATDIDLVEEVLLPVLDYQQANTVLNDSFKEKVVLEEVSKTIIETTTRSSNESSVVSGAINYTTEENEDVIIQEMAVLPLAVIPQDVHFLDEENVPHNLPMTLDMSGHDLQGEELEAIVMNGLIDEKATTIAKDEVKVLPIEQASSDESSKQVLTDQASSRTAESSKTPSGFILTPVTSVKEKTMQEALPHTADQDAKKPMLFAMVMILAGLSLLKKKSETK